MSDEKVVMNVESEAYKRMVESEIYKSMTDCIISNQQPGDELRLDVATQVYRNYPRATVHGGKENGRN